MESTKEIIREAILKLGDSTVLLQTTVESVVKKLNEEAKVGSVFHFYGDDAYMAISVLRGNGLIEVNLRRAPEHDSQYSLEVYKDGGLFLYSQGTRQTDAALSSAVATGSLTIDFVNYEVVNLTVEGKIVMIHIKDTSEKS